MRVTPARHTKTIQLSAACYPHYHFAPFSASVMSPETFRPIKSNLNRLNSSHLKPFPENNPRGRDVISADFAQRGEGDVESYVATPQPTKMKTVKMLTQSTTFNEDEDTENNHNGDDQGA